MQVSTELLAKINESIDFFESFTPGELMALLLVAKEEMFEPDEVVFKEEAEGEKMYIIKEGAVRITRSLDDNEEVLGTLDVGGCFGEMAIIDDSPRSATATADKDGATLLSFKEGVLSERNQLVAFKLYRNLATMLAERLRETNDKLHEATKD